MVIWVSRLPRQRGDRGGDGQGGKSHSSGTPPWCQWRQGTEHEERGCNGDPTLCMSLNNGAFLLWWSGLSPRAFPVAELLTPAHSGCPLLAKNSSLLGSALQTPSSSTQPLCTPVDTRFRLGHTGL